MPESKEPLRGTHYEIRFLVAAGAKSFGQYRTFVTKADSYSGAIRAFLTWANNGEKKFDESRYGIPSKKSVEYKFEELPVTEDCIVSIGKWTY